MKKVLGILAHVDAGKTTLSEALLFNTGVIRKLGRVDSGDAYLDTDEVERERGITIYSKNARLSFGDDEIILIDTPGHVDFSTEMERTLRILDAAILLISATDGVQAHTKTLWMLLKEYGIPTYIFVNKMDMTGADKDMVLDSLKKNLDGDFVSFGADEDFDTWCENLATADERLLEEYMENGRLDDASVSWAIENRKAFPVFFGSALRNEGVKEFLESLGKYMFLNTTEKSGEMHDDFDAISSGKKGELPTDAFGAISSGKRGEQSNAFGAICYKITRDRNGNKLTHIKVLSGTVKVRTILEDEKITEIRLYNGDKYEPVQEVGKGEICVLVGLTKSYIGHGYGETTDDNTAFLEPVMKYRVSYPRDVDTNRMLMVLKELEEEDPTLKVVYDEDTRQILVSLMGEVESNVLKRKLMDKFGIPVSFTEGRVLYKETISKIAEGVGHFEPLRHYAEVHLKLEPLERGSGLILETDVSEDDLARNWQRLIMTHLSERTHKGVLTNSPITDMKITLVSGKAHLKHTEGGDFRQATYRAVRQGLMSLRAAGECRLLEPYYDYTLVLPTEYVGRAMTDITQNYGTCEVGNQNEDGFSTLTGRAPVSCLNLYANEVAQYTKGQGRLALQLSGYDDCHNEEEVLENITYNPEEDLRNPAGSVFCSHGAGTNIPWYEVPDYMHLPYKVAEDGSYYEEMSLDDEEIMRIAKEKAMSASGSLKGSGNLKGAGFGSGFGGGYETISLEEIDSIIKKSSHANANGRQGSYKGISKDRRGRDRVRVYGEAPGVYGTAGTSQIGGSDGKTVGKNTGIPKENRGAKSVKSVKDKYLLVDGYNLIHAWPELDSIATDNLNGAAGRLNDIMCNYQAITGENVIVVYDAYKVAGHNTEVLKIDNITVVYTKEAQTADQYIERYAHENSKKYDITVITSDGLEQVIVLGAGCSLLSSREFVLRVDNIFRQFNETFDVK